MMISVNLRPGQKRKASGNFGKQLAAKLKDLSSKVKDPLLAGAVAAWVVVIAALGWTYTATARAMGAATEQLEAITGEARRFDNLMQQKRRAELIRDSLQTQIAVIRGVDRNRYIWPHVLDEVSKAVPAYTWLTDITGQPVTAGTDSSVATAKFQITGRTVDYQAFTQFLRQLEASPWVRNVTTVRSETVVDQARPVTSFVITAEFAEADSAYIRTVPLAQSVR